MHSVLPPDEPIVSDLIGEPPAPKTTDRAASALLADPDKWHHSEEFYQLAAESAKIGVWELNIATGELYLSPFLKSMLGYADHELENHLDPWCALVHPDDKAPTIAATQDYLEGRTPVYEAEVRRLHKDGNYRWFLARGIALRDANGAPYRLIGSDLDITDRKQTEEKLRVSEERLRIGLQAGNLGMWDWDMTTDVIVWSERVYELHGINPNEFGGSVADFAELIHSEDRERVQADIQNAIVTGQPYKTEFRVPHPDGSIHWLTTTGQAYYDIERKPVRMVGMTYDVTVQHQAKAEREMLLDSERAAREAAQRASRLKDEFLATLSHELRTPLNAIMGWSSMLEQGGLDERLQREGVSAIARNARAQTQIIDDLLDMSRILAGKFHFTPTEVDSIEIVKAAIDTVSPAAQAKNINLALYCHQCKCQVWGDAGRLQQVMWNLLSNAVKFSPPESVVSVYLSHPDNDHRCLEIAVRDCGEGIKPEFLPYVFDRFRQADSSSTRRHGGLGLGLSIVKQVVELHGGRVHVESEGVGKGACFVVSLPCIEVETPSTTLTASLQSGTVASGGAAATRENQEKQPLLGKHLLLVDDETDTLEMTAFRLQHEGAEVITATSAQEAREKLRVNHFDAIISDIGMPGEDGYSFIRYVRGLNENTRNIPAIAMTAFAREEDKQRALNAGFNGHITKPCDSVILVNTLVQLMSIAPQ